MTAGNNRKENTFKKKQVEPEIENPLPVIVEDTNVKKDKKEKTSKEKKTSKESKPQKEKKEAGRLQKIIGILFLCLAVFLGIALISYLVSFFSGHHQEYGYQIFSQKVNIENRTGSSGVFLAQTLIKESFGIGSFFFVYLLTIIGLRLFDTTKINMWSVWKYALLSLIWLPLLFGFLSGGKCGFSNCAILEVQLAFGSTTF